MGIFRSCKRSTGRSSADEIATSGWTWGCCTLLARRAAHTSGEEVTGSGCEIYFEHRLNCSATVSLARSEHGWFKL